MMTECFTQPELLTFFKRLQCALPDYHWQLTLGQVVATNVNDALCYPHFVPDSIDELEIDGIYGDQSLKAFIQGTSGGGCYVISSQTPYYEADHKSLLSVIPLLVERDGYFI
ncbi:hypothetical protein AB6D11_00575 [Vibrio splendidus]